MDNLTSLLVEQSVLGVVLAFAFFWIKKQHAEAKAEREAMQARLFDLIEQTNKFDSNTGHELRELRCELKRLTNRIEGRAR